MAKPTRRLHRVLLLLLTLVFVLLALEIASRLILGPPPTLALASLEEVSRGQGAQETYRVEVDKAPESGLYYQTAAGLRLIPQMRAVIRNHRLNGRNILIETNGLGLRHRELEPKQDDELRVLVLGDSITFADYVDDDETFVRQLETRIISDQESDRRVQVVNAGVGAINLKTEFEILKEKAPSVQPDLLIVALYLNDASTSPVIRPLPYPLRLSQFLRWAQLKSFNLKRRWDGGRSEQDEKWLKEFEKLHTPAQGDWRRDPRALAHEIRQAFGDWGYAWSDHAWSTMRPILGNMRTFAGANGFETIVVLLPVRQQIESQVVNDLPQKHFEDLLSDLRLAHLDLFGTLRDDWRMAQQSLFYDHCHLTPRGNRIVATAIFDFLTAQRFVD